MLGEIVEIELYLEISRKNFLPTGITLTRVLRVGMKGNLF